MENNEYRIVSIADIAALSTEQRARCLVDLVAWLEWRDHLRPLVEAGVMAPITEMVWVDDDRTGECSGVRIIDRQTGNEIGKLDI